MNSLTRPIPLVYAFAKYDRRTGKTTPIFDRDYIAVNASLEQR